MTELPSYDEDAREAIYTARFCIPASSTSSLSANVLNHLAEDRDPYDTYYKPWPICGDELTKRGMK